MKAIQTEKLTKYYGKARGIIEVDLAVEAGDFFGFIGPNGAGKSTLIRTLLGLISASGGRAQIFGKDIVEHKVENLSKIGYLPSEAAFWHGMKVRELLEFSARMHGVDCKSEAAKLCERLELDTSRRIDELSLGNRKKVGIVCALQHTPSLYILDEPTSGLDPLMQKEFYAILKERNEEGATVFLSTHVLPEISRYCKSAAVIREGRLLACDKVENLVSTGIKRVSLKGLRGELGFVDAKDISIENDTVKFLYSGSSAELIRALSSLSFEDVNIADPELDEIFMHYYERGNA